MGETKIKSELKKGGKKDGKKRHFVQCLKNMPLESQLFAFFDVVLVQDSILEKQVRLIGLEQSSRYLT